MFKIEQTDQKLTCEMSSRNGFIDRAVQEMDDFVRGLEGACPTEDLKTCVRELLLNAMEHGNAGDASRSIGLVVENVAPARYKVEVRDEGGGLKPDSLPPRQELEPGQTRRRGLAIVNTCSDLLESGGVGVVRAWFTMLRETVFESELVGAETILRPTGDITATVADPFRKALLGWYESTSNSVCLDLDRVENIDSICLSVLVSFSHMEAVRSGARMVRLIHLKPGIERLFRLTRLHVIFKI